MNYLECSEKTYICTDRIGTVQISEYITNIQSKIVIYLRLFL